MIFVPGLTLENSAGHIGWLSSRNYKGLKINELLINSVLHTRKNKNNKKGVKDDLSSSLQYKHKSKSRKASC